MMEYELINHSDPYTFLAADQETAALVIGILGTSYAAKPKEGDREVPLFLFCPDQFDPWYQEQFGRSSDDGLEAKKPEVSRALASMMLGSFEDRRRYQAALDAITDSAKREQFIATWQNGCSSLNNIGNYAHKLAKKLQPEVAAYSVLRIPTNGEYDRLVEVTGGDDAKMHWLHIFSWVNDTGNEYELDTSSRAHRGYNSARLWNNSSSGSRIVYVGFRPACDLPPEALASVKDGEQMVLGTLYMTGEPVKVPKYPTYNGDIAAYIPGSTLELREPLDDPDYQVAGYLVGDALVADRCLLNMISYEDIEKATMKKERK